MNNISSIMNDSKCLVIGGAGFVGGNLCKRLIQEGASEVHVLDNLLSGDTYNLPHSSKLKFHLGSASSYRDLDSINTDFDYVFQLATLHGNQSSLYDPILDHENNLLPSLVLSDFLIKKKSKVKKLVYSSAGCTVAEKTYDSPKATDEDAPVSLYLDSPYQISKVVGEFYFNFYQTQHKLPVVKARFQNVYGPGEILGAGKWRGTPATIWRNVTPTFIWRALNNMPLTLDNAGETSRDFIYVDDIVEGLVRCACFGNPGDVFNLASGAETTIKTLASSIVKLTQSKSEIILTGKRPWDRSGKRYGTTHKSEEKIGFKVRHDLESGLTNTIRWTQENRALIQNRIAQHDFFINCS